MATKKAQLAKWLVTISPEMAKDLTAWENKAGHSIETLKVLLSVLELWGNGKHLHTDDAYQIIIPKTEGAIARLLDQVEEVFKLWNDPATLKQAVGTWAKVKPILLAVLDEGEKNFDSPGFATGRKAIANIDKAVAERAAAAAAAAAKAKKPLTDHDRLVRIEDRERGHTKVDIGLIGAMVLQKQYDAMLLALEDAKSARVTQIDSWKPSQTPMGGNLLLKIGKGLSVAAAVAFPEVEFLEIAKKGIEIAIKGKEMLDKQAEASKDEAEELKKHAKEELDNLLRHTRKYVAETQGKLQKLIDAAAEKLSADELDALQGSSEPKFVTDFVKDKLGIARGKDVNPNVIGLMETTLLQEFNNWVKEDFKKRKLGKVIHSVAKEGGNSWDAFDLRELYDLKKSQPEYLEGQLKYYDKKHNKPAGWAAGQLKKLEKELDSEFEREFADDKMRYVPANTDEQTPNQRPS